MIRSHSGFAKIIKLAQAHVAKATCNVANTFSMQFSGEFLELLCSFCNFDQNVRLLTFHFPHFSALVDTLSVFLFVQNTE